MKTTIKIGTRKSALAMAQTQLVVKAIKRIHPEAAIEIITMTTKGDKILNRPLVSFGGKAVFVSEFEQAIADRAIDFAVHSAKDMPMELLEGLDVVAVLKRADPRDVLVRKKRAVDPLEVVGTSSLRRQLQMERRYPNVQCKEIRGNVGTRLEKMRAGEYDGIVLAMAGLSRLGLLSNNDYVFEPFNCNEFLPAPGQGIIAIEGRKNDPLSSLIKEINHEETAYRLEIEWEVLRLLNTGCHDPVAVYSEIRGDSITLSVLYRQEERIAEWTETGRITERFMLAARVVHRIRGILNAE